MKVITNEGDRVALEVDRKEFSYLCWVLPKLQNLPHGFDAGSIAEAIDEYTEYAIETYFDL